MSSGGAGSVARSNWADRPKPHLRVGSAGARLPALTRQATRKGQMMKLTTRGEILLASGAAVFFLALMGIAGWIEAW